MKALDRIAMLQKMFKRNSCRSLNYGIFIFSITFAILLLSNAAGAANDAIHISTNRFVVLDDPDNTSGKIGPGFGYPKYSYPTWTYWTGIETKINATALYIDGNGTPIQGKSITFTIYWPNGTALSSAPGTTNQRGLANFSFDLDDRNYYGKWTIRASDGSLGANTSFIYNWWGCAYNSGQCGKDHSSESFPTRVTANSP
ncbi:MAG TPA: MG2 domain-containing protein, partial [Candidatus Methanoperedens sp.]